MDVDLEGGKLFGYCYYLFSCKHWCKMLDKMLEGVVATDVATGVEGRLSKDSSLGVDTEAGSDFFFKKLNKDVCLFMFISIRAVCMMVSLCE